MLKIVYTNHAELQIIERNLDKKLIETILRKPDQLLFVREDNNWIAQSVIEEESLKFLYRVIFIEEKGFMKVLTVYRTTKIGKYLVKL